MVSDLRLAEPEFLFAPWCVWLRRVRSREASCLLVLINELMPQGMCFGIEFYERHLEGVRCSQAHVNIRIFHLGSGSKNAAVNNSKSGYRVNGPPW